MPRITPAGSSRAAYYDRATATKTLAYANSALAPAGNTVRATYTVPAATKSYIQAVVASAARKTVGGTPGLAEAQVAMTPISGTGRAVLASVDLTANTVGDHGHIASPGIGLALTGDILTLETYDDSVGGTMVIVLGAFIAEFAA